MGGALGAAKLEKIMEIIGTALLISGVLAALLLLVINARKWREAKRELERAKHEEEMRQARIDVLGDIQRHYAEAAERIKANKVIPLGDPRHPKGKPAPQRQTGKRQEFAAPYGRAPAPAPAPAPRAAEQRRDDSSDFLANPASPLYSAFHQTDYSSPQSCDSSSSYSSSDSSSSSSCSSGSGGSSSSCGCD